MKKINSYFITYVTQVLLFKAINLRIFTIAINKQMKYKIK